jgi:PEGA domain
VQVLFALLLSATDASAVSAEVLEARSQVTQGDSACKKGARLVFELALPQAVAELERGLAHYAKGVLALDSFKPFAECLLQLGVARYNRGQSAQAFKAFREALGLRAGVKADKDSFSPPVLDVFNRARAEVQAQSTGGVTVVGAPAGGLVHLDGVLVGKLPISLRAIPLGVHWLVVTAPNHEPHWAKIEVGDKQGRVDVYLTPTEKNATETPDSRIDSPPAPSAPVALKAAASAPSVLPSANGHVHPALAVLPLGIAQFAEKRPLAGALFLSAEALLLATNIVTGVLFFQDRAPNGQFRHAAQSQALQVVNLSALTALALVIIGGGVDGYLHR